LNFRSSERTDDSFPHAYQQVPRNGGSSTYQVRERKNCFD